MPSMVSELLYYKMGRIDEAIDYYKRALEIDPSKCRGLFQSWYGSCGQRQFDEAVSLYNKALQI